MEKIIGINEARPKLTSLISLINEGQEPYIITVNSEPKAVLLTYEEYRQLKEAGEREKKMLLKLTLEKVREKASEVGITHEDIEKEIAEARKK